MNGEALGVEAVTDGDGGEGYFTGNDLDGSWDASNAGRIALTANGADISGGAYFADGAVHIVSAGRYVLTGELEGSVVIDATNSDKIWLLLDGVAITNPDGAAIDVEQAEKVFLTLAEGSENAVSSAAFTDASTGVDGAIYSRDDLTINGSGSLSVESAGHGIVGNDDLVIAGGTLDITAAEDGIHANDSVRIRDAHITVSAGDDGVTVSNDGGTGYFYMESGALAIPACYEGVEGQQITVAGGEISIVPTDDGFNAAETGSAINITGGSVRIVNETGRDADGLDSNGSIYVSGGFVFISVSESGGCAALDAGTESGGVCQISGGTVVAAGSGTMAESFDADSPQGFIVSATRASAGAGVTLTDGNGNVLVDETIPCAFSSLILSAPGMKNGDAVTLTIDGAATELTVDNSASTGFTFGGMFGGMGGFGGRGQRPGQTETENQSGTGSGSDTGGTEGNTTPPSGDSGDLTPPEGNFSDMTPPDGNFSDLTPPEGGFDGSIPAFGGTDGENADVAGGSETTEGSENTGGNTDDTGGFFNRGGRGDMQPGGDRGGFQDQQTGAETQPPQTGAATPATLLLTLISALVLAAGILIACKVRH